MLEGVQLGAGCCGHPWQVQCGALCAWDSGNLIMVAFMVEASWVGGWTI